MPVGRSFIIAATAGVEAAALLSNQRSGPDIYRGEREVSDSQGDVLARGGQIASGPQRPQTSSFGEQLVTARNNIASVAFATERMYIQSVDRPEEIVQAQFNPEKLKENIGIDWARFNIPGLSYQPQQYGNTNNVQYRFELVFNAAAGASVRDTSGSGAGRAPTSSATTLLEKILKARKQLLAWAVLSNRDQLGGLGDTQRLLFVWPNFISLTCNLVSVEFEYVQFNLEGPPVLFSCDVLLEEVRDVAIYAEDILAQGTMRSGRAPETI
jgi:hypothetical protein